MVKLQAQLDEGAFTSRMIITVHDELVFDVPQPELPPMARLVKKAMEATASLSVPLEVTVKTGKNWAEMQSFDTGVRGKT